MFPRLRNLERSFRLIRETCLAVIIGSFCFCGYIYHCASREVRRSHDQIFILYGGKVLEAVAGDRKDNISAEARDHIRNFHLLFFTLDPDEKANNENLSRALYLADGSAKVVYDNLRESGYYAGVVSANMTQRLEVDSVRLDLASYPYYFRCYGQETIVRPTSKVTRVLITEGYLRDASRSDNNAHGFLIERWSILDNHDLKIELRN